MVYALTARAENNPRRIPAMSDPFWRIFFGQVGS
jgi:hypothetical protein